MTFYRLLFFILKRKMKQSYLVTADWLQGLVSGVEDVEPISRRRVEFFMKLLTDAFSPTNFLASNPTAMREIMATGGESLVRGMENFAADLARGGGQLAISQTDYEQFKIGENVATAPGKVVQVLVAAGDVVEKGTPMIVLEAMKMEHTIAAPVDGTVDAVHYAAGDLVEDGAELLAFKPTE